MKNLIISLLFFFSQFLLICPMESETYPISLINWSLKLENNINLSIIPRSNITDWSKNRGGSFCYNFGINNEEMGFLDMQVSNHSENANEKEWYLFLSYFPCDKKLNLKPKLIVSMQNISLQDKEISAWQGINFQFIVEKAMLWCNKEHLNLIKESRAQPHPAQPYLPNDPLIIDIQAIRQSNQ